jgi:membrane protease YdiL (CAAX protease family)
MIEPPILSYVAPKPLRPRVWPTYVNFIVLLTAVVGFQLAVGVAATVYLAATAPRTTPHALTEAAVELLSEPLPFVLMILSVGAIEVAGAVGPALLSPMRFQQRLGLVRPRLPWTLLALAAVGAIGYSFFFQGVAMALSLRSRTVEGLAQALQQTQGLTAALTFSAIGLTGPVAEELFFRGYMQTRLVARHGAVAGILVTALLFGIMHMDPVQSTFAFGFGIYCGIIAQRAASIWPSILAHAVNNSLSIAQAWYLPEQMIRWMWMMLAVAGALAAAIFILPVLVVGRRPAPKAT